MRITTTLLATVLLVTGCRAAPPVIPPTPKPTIDTYAQGLIDAGLSYPGAAVCQSERHPLLMRLADEQAKRQAAVCRQSHDGFQSRYNTVQSQLGGSAAEICAESWKWQENDTPLAVGTEMFKCWRQSSGHWKVASQKHRYFGAAVAKGRNGIWYATILVAD